MAFEKIKDDISDIDSNVRSYIENSMAYYQLKSFKIFMKGITMLTNLIIIGLVIFLALLLLSFAAAYTLGEALGYTLYGFLIMGLVYAIVGFILYLNRSKINKVLLREFSKLYFNSNEN